MAVKLNRIKFLILNIALLVIIPTLIGCSSKPKEDPTTFLKGYYQNFIDGNYISAYNKIASQWIKDLSKDDYVLYEQASEQAVKLKEYKVENPVEHKNKAIDGNTYKIAIEFTVTEKSENYYSSKEETSNYTRFIVLENGTWKVYRDKLNGKKMLSEAYNFIGSMYCDGMGKSKDMNQAAMMFNKAIEYDKDNNRPYYGLGLAYLNLQRYDDSITAINNYLAKETTNEGKSSGYNILGLDYQNKNMIDKSKEMYTKALEANPNNEYAKTNLTSLK